MRAAFLLFLAAQVFGLEAPRNGETDDNNKNPANYNYGYSVSFGEHGSSQGHAEERKGERTHGNYFVNLPNDASHSNVQYIADDFGYHPVVRISTQNGHSQVSSHFALGHSAVKALHEQQPKFWNNDFAGLNRDSKKLTFDFDNSFKFGLENSVDTKDDVDTRTEPATERPPSSKLVETTYNLVSNEDVLKINGAAEEYYDDISEDRLNKEQRINDELSLFNKPIIVDDVDIVSNNLPRLSLSESLAATRPSAEVLISPLKENFLNLQEQHTEKKINVQILDDYNNGQYLIEKVAGEESELTDASRKGNSPTNETLSGEQFESFPKVLKLEGSVLNEIQDEKFNTVPAISDAFLAPLQAGLLLSNDVKDSSYLSSEVQPLISSEGRIEKKEAHSGLSDGTEKSNEQFRGNEIMEQYWNKRKTTTESPVEPTIYVTENIDEVGPTVELLPKRRTNTTAPEDGTVERIIEKKIPVPYAVTEYVDRIVERPVPYLVPFQTIVNRPYPVEKIIEKPIRIPIEVEKFVDRPVHIHVPVPVPVHIPLQNPLLPPPSYPVAYSLHAPNEVAQQHFSGTDLGGLPPSDSVHGGNNGKLCEHHKCYQQQTEKIIKDEYYGPVPLASEHSLWNSLNVRQRRKFDFNKSPRMEYGFKPPLVPSIEIDDQGLPIIRNVE